MQITWRGLSSASIERLSWREGDAVTVRSQVEDGDHRYIYEVELDTGWEFRRLNLRTGDGRGCALRRDENASWTLDGAAQPDLAAAVDIDLAFSPFTNTLPIRRLRPLIGTSFEIITAYVDATTLEVAPDPQRYTRIAQYRYLYESLNSDFRREIVVDADGFVVEYPGLFARSTGIEPSGAC